jgi:hypothetical protein
MNIKITRFVPVLVLLCLTVFGTAAFSANHSINTVWKQSESGSNHDQHYGSMFVGDPVGGGGTPKDVNRTLDSIG